MPLITAEELLKVKPVAGAIAGASSRGDSFWSPQSIMQVIDGIKKLMQMYVDMRAGGGRGNDGVMTNEPRAIDPGAQVGPTPQGITMPQVIAVAKQFLDNLESQGHGDATLLQVLEKTPFTIKQLRGFLG